MDRTPFDVVVVGAGMAGASVAAELALDRSVLLLEKEQTAGRHATGRSAASYIPSYRALNPALRALTQASKSFFDTTPTGFTTYPLLKKRGLLTLLGSASTIETEREREALNTVLATPIERLTTEQVKSRLPALSANWQCPAWWEADVHDIDVDALHQGYLRLLRHRGGSLKTSQDVSAKFADGRWEISTENLRIASSVVVNATGAWADHFAERSGVAPIGLVPKRRTAILVDPPVHQDITSWPLVLAYDESFYFKPDAGLLLVSPVDEHLSEPCDAQPEEIDIAYAADFAMQALDGMSVTHIPHSWAGLRTFAPDSSPVVGFDPIKPGFFWCAGQGGHGIQIAPAVAQLSASLIRDTQPVSSINGVPFDPQWISPARFQKISNKTQALPH